MIYSRPGDPTLTHLINLDPESRQQEHPTQHRQPEPEASLGLSLFPLGTVGMNGLSIYRRGVLRGVVL